MTDFQAPKPEERLSYARRAAKNWVDELTKEANLAPEQALVIAAAISPLFLQVLQLESFFQALDGPERVKVEDARKCEQIVATYLADLIEGQGITRPAKNHAHFEIVRGDEGVIEVEVRRRNGLSVQQCYSQVRQALCMEPGANHDDLLHEIGCLIDIRRSGFG